MFEVFNVGLVVGEPIVIPHLQRAGALLDELKQMKNRPMQNAGWKSRHLLFFGGFSLLMLGACVGTPQQTDSVESTADAKPLTRRALDALNPLEYTKVLNKPQEAMFAEVQATFREARGKIAEIDISALNTAIEELHESLETMAHRIDSTSTESIEPLAESWRETGVRLSAATEQLEKKIAAIETEQLNHTMQEASKAADSWRASGEELQALLADVRALLAGVDSKQITETVERVRESAESLRLATAKLPSTTTSLSTTIWLLNGLLAIGITLGVLRIVRHRTTKQ